MSLWTTTLAGAAAVLALAGTAHAQCAPVQLSRSLLPVRTVETIDANRVLVGREGRLEIYNVSTPSNPVLTGGVAMGGETAYPFKMRSSATRAWVLSLEGTTLTERIYSVTGTTPLLIDTQTIGPSGRTSWDCIGNLSFIASVEIGQIQVVDVTFGGLPLLVGSYAGAGWTTFERVDIQVEGSRAYVRLKDDQSSTERFEVIDVSNPAAPTLLGSYSQPAASGLFSVAPYSIVAYSSRTPTAQAMYLGSLPSVFAFDSAMYGRTLAANGALIYSLDGGSVRVHDAAQNILVPPLLSTFAVYGSTSDIAFSSTRAYVAAGEAGWLVLNAANPSALSQTAWVDDSVGQMYDWLTSPSTGLRYGVDGGGLRVLSFSNPASPQVANTIRDPDDSRFGSALSGTWLHNTTLTGAIKTWSLASPTAPTLVSTVNFGSATGNLARSGNRLYQCSSTGIRVINVTAPSSPTLVSTYTPIGYTRNIQAANGLLYATTINGAIWILSIANPDAPHLLGFVSPTPGYSSFWFSLVGTRLFSLRESFGNNRVEEFDVSNPAAPVLRSRTRIFGDVDNGMRVSGTRVLLLGVEHVSVYDASVSGELPRIARVSAPGVYFTNASAIGASLVTSDFDGGIRSYSLPTQWPPSVVEFPEDQAVCQEGIALIQSRFRASPSAMTYRWFHNGLPMNDDGHVTGAFTDSLYLTQITLADAGLYRCVATNSCGASGQDECTMWLTVCLGDFNCSGGVDGDDVIEFFAAWDAGLIAGDVNRDGSVDGDDVIAFFGAWDFGC